jgi:hypothetical protein
MPHEFLSPEWVEAVQQLRERYRDRTPDVEIPAVRVNLRVADAPFEGGEIAAHTDTSSGELALGLGYLDDPNVTIKVDYATLRTLVIEQQPQAGIKAFLLGKIKIEGDLAGLVGNPNFDPAQLPALLSGFTNVQSLGDIDPLAAELGEEIKALTAS